MDVSTLAISVVTTVVLHDLNVLLVEDSVLLAERLGELLKTTARVELVGVVADEMSALKRIGEGGIDVVVLDLHLRQGTGFGVLRGIRNKADAPVVIVLTNYDLREYRDAAAALGAWYFLDKGREMERLTTVLGEVFTDQNPN